MNFTSKVLMCKPSAFGFNEETGLTNSFQRRPHLTENANEAAWREFDSFVELLRKNGIEVIVIEDTVSPSKPDAIFLNNWFSTHVDGTIVLYPMQTANRRIEVRQDVVDKLVREYNFSKVVDLRANTDKQLFLEGTGSIVFDHANRKCYASISSRTSVELVGELCEQMHYKPVVFNSRDKNGNAIYHTNVLMCIGEGFCVACLDAIVEKELILNELRQSNLELIEIVYEEMENFAGNMLMLKNNSGENVLVMSERAFRSLAPEKIKKLESFASIIHPEIPVIESIGGGSARCMMAELFHP